MREESSARRRGNGSGVQLIKSCGERQGDLVDRLLFLVRVSPVAGVPFPKLARHPLLVLTSLSMERRHFPLHPFEKSFVDPVALGLQRLIMSS